MNTKRVETVLFIKCIEQIVHLFLVFTWIKTGYSVPYIIEINHKMRLRDSLPPHNHKVPFVGFYNSVPVFHFVMSI